MAEPGEDIDSRHMSPHLWSLRALDDATRLHVQCGSWLARDGFWTLSDSKDVFDCWIEGAGPR